MTMVQKIDKLMDERSLNRRSLAKHIGIPYQTIVSLYKNERNGANTATVLKIARFFGVTVDYLIDNEVTKDKNEIQRLYDIADEKTKRMIELLLTGVYRSGNQ